ncbi:RNase H domain-containing protein [Trichonephila clavipes]|nr:RNase H domain-containing protein [Trichonephila clavipes]
MPYVDDLQISCQGSDMRLIERPLQTTVNRLVKWCDRNCHTIFPSKSSCVPFCRNRNLDPDPLIHLWWKCERSLNILNPRPDAVALYFGCTLVLAKTFLGSPVNIIPHKSLNTFRGVISEPDLATTSEAEILDGFSDQGFIQAQILPSTSSLIVTSLESQPPIPLIDITPTTSNSLSTSSASSSNTVSMFTPLPACPVLQTTTTTSNTTPSISEDAKLSSKFRKKKRPPKNTLYGSARASVFIRLDTIHHSALRICSGAFRTSPVQSLYVTCNQLPLNLRRKKQALVYYFKILSVRSRPLKNGTLTIRMKRIYDARPHNIRPFMERTKLLLSEIDLLDVDIHQRNLLQFQT